MNNNSKLENIAEISFLIIGFITVLEYMLVRGLFTAFIMMALSVIAGVINCLLALVYKKYMNFLFFLLLTIALNMGYIVLL